MSPSHWVNYPASSKAMFTRSNHQILILKAYYSAEILIKISKTIYQKKMQLSDLFSGAQINLSRDTHSVYVEFILKHYYTNTVMKEVHLTKSAR